MSLQQMQLLGSNKYVASLYNFGKQRADIIGGLMERFPGQTTADYNAALQAGLNGVSAAQLYDQVGPNDPFLEGLIPSGGGPGDCYRIHVLGVLTDSFSGTNETIQLPVDFDHLPNQQELDAGLASATRDRYLQGPAAMGRYASLPDPIFTPFETLLIEGC